MAKTLGNRQAKLRERALRLPLGLEVATRTIGSHTTFNLRSKNISRSGLLLHWDKDLQVPYNVNTLLEIMIDPEKECLDQAITCLGKVVRKDPDGSNQPFHIKLAVEIVQIDPADMQVWEDCVIAIENKLFLIEK